MLYRILQSLVLVALSVVHPWLAAHEVVRMAVFDNPPLITYDERTGAAGGVFIEIAEATAKREGWTLAYVPGTFSQGLERLNAGEVDLLPTAPYTRGRRSELMFNEEPVVASWGQVYARQGSAIKNIQDLAGKRIAMLDGSLLQESLGALTAALSPAPAQLPFSRYKEAFEAVVDGRADAVLSNPFTGATQARASGLRPTPVVLEPYSFRFATALHGRAEWLAALDRTVNALKADPSSIYYAQMEKLTRAEGQFAFPPWFKWAALASSAVLLIGVSWALTLQRAARRIALSERSHLRLAEELRRISDNSLDVIAVLDGSFNIIRINQAAQTLWGYKPMELEGKSCFEVIAPDDRPAARHLLESVRGGKSVRSSPSRVQCNDGTVARMVWSLAWSEQEQEMYAIGHDDTARHELIQHLRAKKLQLEAANDGLRSFAQSVSHDLRAPVAAIEGFVGKVLRDEHGRLQDRSESLLARAHVASKRMDEIIANLLRLARLTDAGVHRRSCDITAISQDVATCLRNADPQRQVTVTVQPGMTAHADRDLLRHVIDNLLSNAWKFTAGMQPASIAVGCDDEGPEPVFFVSDTGVGFDMENAGGLFAPFTRLHEQACFQGTGLGLSIAHRVVTAHGGRIWATSAPGEGAVFRFTLGQRAPHSAAQRAAQASVA